MAELYPAGRSTVKTGSEEAFIEAWREFRRVIRPWRLPWPLGEAPPGRRGPTQVPQVLSGQQGGPSPPSR